MEQQNTWRRTLVERNYHTGLNYVVRRGVGQYIKYVSTQLHPPMGVGTVLLVPHLSLLNRPGRANSPEMDGTWVSLDPCWDGKERRLTLRRKILGPEGGVSAVGEGTA